MCAHCSRWQGCAPGTVGPPRRLRRSSARQWRRTLRARRRASRSSPTTCAPRIRKRAVAAAQDATAALPDNVEVLYAAAQAQQAAGESNQAIATYNKIAQLRPGSPAPFLRIAEVKLAAKDTDAALLSLRKALAVKPDFVEAQRTLIAVHLQANQTKEALAVARDVQKQRPKESAGYLFEGDFHLSRKAWTEAVTVYRAGLKQSKTTDLAVRLDAALRAGGREAEADKFAATWLKENPKDIPFRSHMAQNALTKKDLGTAAREYKLILESNPNDILALNNLAWVSGQLKDPKALDYAERAYAIAPRNPAIMDTLGMLLVQQGDSKRGIELLKEAVALAPNAGGIRLNLARALIKAGQKEAAKKELDVLAKLGEKFPAQSDVARLMKEL